MVVKCKKCGERGAILKRPKSVSSPLASAFRLIALFRLLVFVFACESVWRRGDHIMDHMRIVASARPRSSYSCKFYSML